MWKDDNDKIGELYLNLKEIKEFPAICPVCGKKEAHIYMRFYDDKTRRGGLWCWCSDCQSFSHGSLRVPEYWENDSFVELEKLSALPIYLNSVKGQIDKHTNSVISNI